MRCSCRTLRSWSSRWRRSPAWPTTSAWRTMCRSPTWSIHASRRAPTGPWRRRPCALRARSLRGKGSGTSSSWLHSQSKEPSSNLGAFKVCHPQQGHGCLGMGSTGSSAATRSGAADASSGSIAGLREQRLTDSTIHETGPPESRHSPPAPPAAFPPMSRPRQAAAPRLSAPGRSADRPRPSSQARARLRWPASPSRNARLPSNCRDRPQGPMDHVPPGRVEPAAATPGGTRSRHDEPGRSARAGRQAPGRGRHGPHGPQVAEPRVASRLEAVARPGSPWTAPSPTRSTA